MFVRSVMFLKYFGMAWLEGCLHVHMLLFCWFFDSVSITDGWKSPAIFTCWVVVRASILLVVLGYRRTGYLVSLVGAVVQFRTANVTGSQQVDVCF